MECKKLLNSEFSNSQLVNMALFKLSKSSVITQLVSTSNLTLTFSNIQELNNIREWLTNITVKDLYDTKTVKPVDSLASLRKPVLKPKVPNHHIKVKDIKKDPIARRYMSLPKPKKRDLADKVTSITHL